MKLPLLLLALAAAGSAGAQRPLDSLQAKLRERLAGRYPQMPNAFAPRKAPFVMKAPGIPLEPATDKALPYLALQVAPGTYALPQDGTPCIVPDTKGIAAIPNAAPVLQVPFSSNIPNPYAPDPRDKTAK
ncbi:MAG: hypothetical protein EOO11_02275 [Chitinophagaceae bacterium]|nr:MAG: hypothetical protein EOO11_02275 [Chitinophagaceae bacterium]